MEKKAYLKRAEQERTKGQAAPSVQFVSTRAFLDEGHQADESTVRFNPPD